MASVVRVPGPKVDPRFGQRLRKMRTDAGLTQKALAAPRYTKAYVSALETGHIRASMAALDFLAPRLGTTPSKLLDFEDRPYQYASLSWSPEDVTAKAEDLNIEISLDEAGELLSDNERLIRDRLTETGFDVIETLLIMQNT